VHSGLTQIDLEKPVISLIAKGRKIIYERGKAIVANTGDMLYMPAGRHYVDFRPLPDGQFEEIVVTFERGEFTRHLAMLGSTFGLNIAEHRQCPECRGIRYAVFPSWRPARLFFASLMPYLRAEGAGKTIESLKKLELLALIATNPECCIQSRIFGGNDSQADNFEAVIRENLFCNIPLAELARLTNRSLTSFKNEFKRRFYEPPHVWQNRQRLAHARMLLITTNLPVAETGARCAFSNASHFIRLFVKEYGVTPAVYRKRYQAE
jgi:AraC-like DNA-binding protein